MPDDIIVESGYEYLRQLNTELNMLRLRMVLMYYNDSKGTNPEAAVKAIEAMANVLQFLSAEDMIKVLNLTLYVKAFKDKVKLLVLIGQTSAKIAAYMPRKYGFDSIIEYADSMEQVVEICATECGK